MAKNLKNTDAAKDNASSSDHRDSFAALVGLVRDSPAPFSPRPSPSRGFFEMDKDTMKSNRPVAPLPEVLKQVQSLESFLDGDNPKTPEIPPARARRLEQSQIKLLESELERAPLLELETSIPGENGVKADSERGSKKSGDMDNDTTIHSPEHINGNVSAAPKSGSLASPTSPTTTNSVPETANKRKGQLEVTDGVTNKLTNGHNNASSNGINNHPCNGHTNGLASGLGNPKVAGPETLSESFEKLDGLVTALAQEIGNARIATEEMKRRDEQMRDSVRPNKSLVDEMDNLVKTVAEKDKLINELASQLAVEKAMNGELSEQLQKMAQRPNPQNQIASLQELLKKSSAETDRLRNENRDLNKIAQDKHLAVKRMLEGGTLSMLKGAAHLVQPSPMTKLPKAVVGCIECYVMNRQCDNKVTCESCSFNNARCLRFRCSVQHTLKAQCPDFPICALKHNKEGWLESYAARPEW